MQFVLTIILILSGTPHMQQFPTENLDQCLTMASEFLRTQQAAMTAPGDQIAAGCAVVKTDADRDA